MLQDAGWAKSEFQCPLSENKKSETESDNILSEGIHLACLLLNEMGGWHIYNKSTVYSNILRTQFD